MESEDDTFRALIKRPHEEVQRDYNIWLHGYFSSSFEEFKQDFHFENYGWTQDEYEHESLRKIFGKYGTSGPLV